MPTQPLAKLSQLANSARPAINVVTGTTATAVSGQHYVMTNAALTTITLPASPSVGDVVQITVANDLMTNNVAPNGQKIANTTDNLTINMKNATVTFKYVSVGFGWLVE